MLSDWMLAVRIWGDFLLSKGYTREFVEDCVEKVYLSSEPNLDAMGMI